MTTPDDTKDLQGTPEREPITDEQVVELIKAKGPDDTEARQLLCAWIHQVQEEERSIVAEKVETQLFTEASRERQSREARLGRVLTAEEETDFAQWKQQRHDAILMIVGERERAINILRQAELYFAAGGLEAPWKLLFGTEPDGADGIMQMVAQPGMEEQLAQLEDLARRIDDEEERQRITWEKTHPSAVNQ